MPEQAPCAHCGRPRRRLARRLCERCYRDPAVRELHPPVACCWTGTQEVPDRCGTQALPAAPCAHAQGSPEKLAALQARARAGLQLHHPQDLNAR